MSKKLGKKLENLKKILYDMDSAVLAYSGGVDSSLLLKVARDVLGDKVLAVIAKSPTYPNEEYTSAVDLARRLKIKYVTIKTEELSSSKFYKNSTDRCFFCKKELFSKLKKIAKKRKFNWIIEGSNADDIKDFRPGAGALKELKIRSPLQEAKLKKNEIRAISKKLKLSTWDKPSFACLASRFPYNTKITQVDLRRVEKAEYFLRNNGFKQVRVRHYGNLARIEILQEDISKLIKADYRKIINRFKKVGYNYITIDLEGYRTGSMNEVLSNKVLL